MPPIEKNTQLSTGAASKKRKSAKKTGAILLNALSKHQHEILGASIVLLSLLLLIAIIAYSPDDDSVIENVTLFEFFSEAGKLAVSRLRNPLGFFWCKTFRFSGADGTGLSHRHLGAGCWLLGLGAFSSE